MDDLISRQVVIEIIQSMYPGILRIPWMRKDWQKRYEPYIRVENAIRELPSAQPEQKTGRWGKRYISDYRFQYCCSECGMIQVYGEPNYCPNCGARMDGETE